MGNVKLLLAGLYCLLLVACGSRGLLVIQPAVEVEIVNRSSRELENTYAQLGEHRCKWGVVVVMASKSYLQYPNPITANTELHWDEVGGHRVKKIDLSKIYPKNESGRLTFTVYDDRVEVSFREKS